MNNKNVRTLSDYLKSINRAGGYVDRRKDHYRVKTKPFTAVQQRFLNSIPGITAYNEYREIFVGHKVEYGIIRTDTKLKEKIVK